MNPIKHKIVLLFLVLPVLALASPNKTAPIRRSFNIERAVPLVPHTIPSLFFWFNFFLS